jgi:hypothetical protein
MSDVITNGKNLIPLERAKKLTGFYKEERGRLINPSIAKKDVIPYSETFDRSAIDLLLKLEGCVGIRIYQGLDEEFKLHSIIVGVNEKGEDLIIPDSTEGGEPAEGGGFVVEDAVRCPPNCPTDGEGSGL